MSRNSCDKCGGIQGAHTADCPNRVDDRARLVPVQFGPCVRCKTPAEDCHSPGCCETCADSSSTHRALRPGQPGAPA